MLKNTFRKINHYFSFILKTVRDLIKAHPLKTSFILCFSIITPLIMFAELKFIEIITNGVANIGQNDNLIYILLVFAAILLGTKILDWIYDLIQIKYSKDITVEKQQKLYAKIGKIKYDYFEDSDLYNKMWLASQAPGEFVEALGHFSYLIRTAAKLIIFAVLISQINFLFVLGFIVAFFVSLALNKSSLTRWDDYYDQYVVPHQRRSIYFEEILKDRVNHQTIQSNRQLPFFALEYEKYADNERKYTLRMNILSFFVEICYSVMFVVVMLIMLVYIASNIVSGKAEIGTFAMITTLSFNLMHTSGGLISFIFSNKEYIRKIDSYNQIMSLENQTPPKVDNENLPFEHRELKMNDITYTYRQSNRYALESLNCCLKNGTKISLVGENGSGKTTLMMVLMGMLTEYKGALTNTVGNPTIIMQDFQYYQMSIRENVELGRGGERIPDDELKQILTEVDLWSHIETLPNGVDTIIGQLEDGTMFSKGQFQRLAIARLLANKNADIWILDEPTAYLDPIAEIDMYNYILSLANNRLVIFISHRLGFSRKADQILVMKDGRIAETGSHEELMSLEDGLYRNMYNIQKSWYSD